MKQKKYVICLTTTLLLGQALPLTQALAAEQAQQVVSQESSTKTSAQSIKQTETTTGKSTTETTQQSKTIPQNTTTAESSKQSVHKASTEQTKPTKSSEVQSQAKSLEGSGTVDDPYIVNSYLEQTGPTSYYKLVEGGEIKAVAEGSTVVEMSGGTVGFLQGTITEQTGGTVQLAVATGKIETLKEGGIVDSLTSGGSINNMNGGLVNNIESKGKIINQSGGTVNRIKEFGTIETLTSGLVKWNDGTISAMADGFVVNNYGSVPSEGSRGMGVVVEFTEVSSLISDPESKDYQGTPPYDFQEGSKWGDYVHFKYTDMSSTDATGPTAPSDVGSYQVSADIVYNADTIQSVDGGIYSIVPKEVEPDIESCKVNDKVYDGKKVFTIKSIGFKGVLPEDVSYVNFDVSELEAIGDKNVGDSVPVEIKLDPTKIKIIGDEKIKNYKVSDQIKSIQAFGKVTPFPLHTDHVQFSQTNKPFDGTAKAPLTASVSNSAIQIDENGKKDDLKIKISNGFYGDGKIGNGKAITYEWHLDGTDAKNYQLPNQKPELHGDITGPIMTDGIQAKIVEKLEKYEPKKKYDGQTDESFSLDVTDCIDPEGTSGETFELLVDGKYEKKDAGAQNFTVTNWEILDDKATMGDLPKITLNGVIERKIVEGVWNPAAKIYDGTTAISLTGKIEPKDLIAGDDVTITAEGNFQQKNVGNNLTINYWGFTTEGKDAANYNVSIDSDHVGDITKKRVDSFTWQAENKVYDGTKKATAKANSDLLILGDDVVIEGNGTFANKNVSETPQDVTIPAGGISSSGVDKGNYDLALENEYTAQAVITPYSLLESQIQFIDKDRPFNTTNHSNLKAELMNEVPFASDDVKIDIENATYLMSDIGSSIPITYDWKLNGNDSKNYRLPMSKPVVTGAIGTPTVEGTVQERIIDLIESQKPTKVYDGKTASTFNLDITQCFTPAARLLNPTKILLEVSGNYSGKNVGNQTFTASDWKVTSGNAKIGEFPNENITANGRITKKAVTIDWQGTDKEYDGTKKAEITGTPQGLESGDEVTVSGTGQFTDKNAGTNRMIAINEIKADGRDAGNYSYPETGTAQAGIFAKPIQISWSCEPKEYDGTTAAHVTSQITGIIGDDKLELISTAKYSDAIVGNQKAVDIEFSGKGDDVGNYSFETIDQTTGDITPRLLTVDWKAANKIYDGTTTAKIIGTPKNAVAGDDISIQQDTIKAEFTDANVGAGKKVHMTNIQLVDNADAQNYHITNEADTTGEVKPKALTITGVKAVDRTVNDSKEVKLDGENAKLEGVIQQDSENVRFELGSGTMSSVEVGKNKPVATKIQLTGEAAGNYGLIQPKLTVNISAKASAGTGSNTQTSGKTDNQNKPGNVSSAQAKSGRSYSPTSSQKKPTSLLRANDSVNPAYTGAGIGIASLAAILAWLKRKKR